MPIRTYGNRLISRWQSALNEVLSAEERLPDLGSDHPAMVATCAACQELEEEIKSGEKSVELARPVASGDLLGECARLYVQLLRAKIMGDDRRSAQIESQIRYSVCDPIWAKTLLEFRKSDDLSMRYRRYTALDDFVLDLPPAPRLRIALVSDWGTGTDVAKNVMRRISEDAPDLVIHLGDIYYSCTRREAEENFLNVIRDYLPADTPVFSLAGNHDVYGGGSGYYWLIDQLGQPASYFCLRNEHWQVLAIGAPTESDDPRAVLDTAPAVDEKELEWHFDKLQNAGGRKTIMLSHYQLFTASGAIARDEQKRPLAVNPPLFEAFESHLPKIDAWLWGHEHNLIAFEPYLGLHRGRSIGSGALPVPLFWQPYKQLPDLVTPDGIEAPPRMNLDVQLGHDEEQYHHGYALLDLEGRDGTLDYRQVAGLDGKSESIFTESI